MILGRALSLTVPRVNATGGVGQLRYSLGTLGDRLPPGVHLEEDTGLFFGTPDELGTFVFSLFATDEVGARAPVLVAYRITVVAPPDCANVTHGPNERGCGQGICVDGVPRDGKFTCNCSALPGQRDANCVPVPASLSGAGGSQGESTLALGLAGAFAALFVVAGTVLFVVWRRQRRRQVEHRLALAKLRDSIEKRLNTEVLVDSKNRFSRQMLDHLELSHRSQLTILQALGQGEYGEVTLALLEGQGEVAVKKLRGNAEQEQQERFLMEVWLTASLSHPNIIRVLGLCTREAPFLVALEFMAGGDLRSYLVAHPGTSPSQLFSVTEQLASALAYLATCGVIHRDLAARNVLVAKADSLALVKLADFGMSRGLEESAYYRQTSDDRVPIKWLVRMGSCLLSTSSWLATLGGCTGSPLISSTMP
jgi:hypothetical protein